MVQIELCLGRGRFQGFLGLALAEKQQHSLGLDPGPDLLFKGFYFAWRGSLRTTLRYAIMFPGRKSGSRDGFRPDSNRESVKIGPLAGRRADFYVFQIGIRPKSGPEAQFPARRHYCLM